MVKDIRQLTVDKLNLKIIPFIVLCYFVANLDKTNISIAALQMNADLGLTASMYGWGVGVFYISYILFEVPSNIIMTRVGARLWIARILITWGIISSAMAFVQSANQLYVMRFLLGWAEAGFAPGIIYYLSCWYPKANRARAMSFFYMGSVSASIIGLPLSGAILNMSGLAGIMGWRWLFLIEGLPALLLGILAFRFLPQRPRDVNWLSHEQKHWLEDELATENAQDTEISGSTWKRMFTTPLVSILAVIWFLQAFSSIGMTIFLPLVLKSMQVSDNNLVIGTLSSVPFILACIFMYVNGRHSDQHGERAWHMGIPLILSGLCMFWAIYSSNIYIAYVMMCLSVGLNFALTPVFWATTTEKLSGVASAASIALINSIANLVGLGLPPVLGKIKDATQSYQYGLLIICLALIIGGFVCLIAFGSRRRMRHSASI